MVHYNSTNIPPEVVASLAPYLQSEIPQYEDSWKASIYTSAIITYLVAVIAVVLRLYSRCLKAQPFKWDEYTIIIALVLTTGAVGCTLAETHMGFGSHTVVTILEHPDQIETIFKLLYSGAVITCAANIPIKLSFILLYYRIFGPSTSSNVFKWICISTGVFMTCDTLVAVFTALFSCTPIASNWDMSIRGHCVSFSKIFTVSNSIDVFCDVLLFVIPMPFIWRMKTTVRRKMQISVMFLLGFFIVGISVFRVVYIYQASMDPNSGDILWRDAQSAMWAVTCRGLGILSACLPVMRPVFNKVVHGSAEWEGAMGSSDRSDENGLFSTIIYDGPGHNAALVTIGGGVPRWAGGKSSTESADASKSMASHGIQIISTTSVSCNNNQEQQPEEFEKGRPSDICEMV